MLHEGNTKSGSNSPVPDNLRAALAESDLTQEKLARVVDVTVRTVSAWCNGETELRWAKLTLVAEALGREPQWFYADNDTEDIAA